MEPTNGILFLRAPLAIRRSLCNVTTNKLKKLKRILSEYVNAKMVPTATKRHAGIMNERCRCSERAACKQITNNDADTNRTAWLMLDVNRILLPELAV